MGFLDSVHARYVAIVESLGKQLDPNYTYTSYSFSPRGYLSQYSVRDYIRIVAIIGAYALIIRPLVEKLMSWLRDRATAQGKGPTPVAVDLPDWERDAVLSSDGELARAHDSQSSAIGGRAKAKDPFDWGANARRRHRDAQIARENQRQDAEDAEIDKYLD